MGAVSLLLLSAWFRWFPFNEHKGWTVLIAGGMVGVAVVLLLLWFGISLVSRHRFQFSIRSLLLFVLVVAVVCSWFAVKMQQARRQREAVKIAYDLSGTVVYDYQVGSSGSSVKPPAPAWLRPVTQYR